MRRRYGFALAWLAAVAIAMVACGSGADASAESAPTAADAAPR